MPAGTAIVQHKADDELQEQYAHGREPDRGGVGGVVEILIVTEADFGDVCHAGKDERCHGCWRHTREVIPPVPRPGVGGVEKE